MNSNPTQNNADPSRKVSFQAEHAVLRRKTIGQDDSLVTNKMLQTINVNIQNPEHSQIVSAILKKKSSLKSDLELLFLNDAFQDIAFFEKMRMEMSSEDILNLFKQLKIETYEAGETLFNFGDWGDKFYVIIKGAVYIMLKKSNELAEKSDQKNQHSRVRKAKSKTITVAREESFKSNEAEESTKSESQNDGATKMFEFTDDLDDEEKLKIIKQEFPGFFLARVMETGAAFGEIALQNKTQRTATVVCKTNSTFGILTREDYNRHFPIIDWVYKKRDEENLELLKTFNLFSHLPNSKLNEIYFHLEKKTFQKNHVVYLEGQAADNIYFIKSGEVELSRSIHLPEANQNRKKSAKFDSPKSFLHHLFVNNTEQAKKKVKYSILSVGHYFGIEELFARSDRINTAIVSSLSCDMFVMSHQIFRKLVTDRELIRVAKKNIDQRALLALNMTSNLSKVDELFLRDNNSSGSNSPLPKLKVNSKPSLSPLNKELDSKSADTLALKEKLMSKVNGHVSSFYIRDKPLNEEPQPRLSLLNVDQEAKRKTSLSLERKSVQLLSGDSVDSPNKIRRALRTTSIEALSTKFDLDKASSPTIPSKFHQNSMMELQPEIQSRKDTEESLSSSPFTLLALSPTKAKATTSPEILAPSLTNYSSQVLLKSPMKRTKNSLSTQSFSKVRTEPSPDEPRHFEISRYKSLCKTLKLDKLLKAKDHIDSCLSDINLKSTKHSFNQELSVAIDSFKNQDAKESFNPLYQKKISPKESKTDSLMRRKLKTMII